MNNAVGSESGVYFDKSDYASLPTRLLVAGVDLLVLVVFACIVSWIWSFWADSPDINGISKYGWLAVAIFYPKYFWVITLAAYFYLAIAKRSYLRTIGYRIFGLRVVDLKGNQPSLLVMSWRFILLIFGPFHLLMDLFWLGGDENRQTLRDKFAGTYVVRTNAKPAGAGAIIYERYYLFGLSMIFKKVRIGGE